jgi:hypothetical protein
MRTLPIVAVLSACRAGLLVLCLLAVAAGNEALAQGAVPPKGRWDQVANIKEAAVRLAELQQARGVTGPFQFISACYKTHTLASDYSRALEGCLIQDIIHSSVTALVYSRLSPQQRAETRVPEPDVLTKSMASRVLASLGQYKRTEADAQALIALVNTHGMPAYSKARFPAGEPSPKAAE